MDRSLRGGTASVNGLEQYASRNHLSRSSIHMCSKSYPPTTSVSDMVVGLKHIVQITKFSCDVNKLVDIIELEC
jgi:hypothetical protein